MRPVVVAVAITGSVPRKLDNPAVPITPPGQVESTHAAFEAGAALVHIQVRNADETPSSDPALFAQVQDGVRRHCPGMIIQFSTGGRGRDPAARGNALDLCPDMASLSTGSVNFPSTVYENSAALVTDLATRMQTHHVRPEIELFDFSHIHGACRLIEAGLMDDHPHVQVVMGIKNALNALPAEDHVLDVMVAEIRRLLPRATWTAAGIGINQSRVMERVLARGGDGVRTGLEDNTRISRGRLASCNHELVQPAAEIMQRHTCRPATAAETRAMLGLDAAYGSGRRCLSP